MKICEMSRYGSCFVRVIGGACPLALLTVLTLVVPLSAQQPANQRFADVRAFIGEAVEEHELPSVSVAVAKDGRIIWAEGFGWADIDRRIPATAHTMYSLASISKPMTATGLMRLVERGQVDLDRPANDYLVGGRIHSPAWDPEGATVRRVLSHTAGLPLHWEFFYEGEDHPRRTTAQGIERFGVLVTPPGELYQYSNLGYGILDEIIERVSGRAYGDFLETEVFEPLGMDRSVVSTGAGLGDGAAVRYDADNRPVPYYDFDHRGGSAVYSSAIDLVRFGAYHLGNLMEGQQRILEDSTILAMQRVLTPGTGPREQGYGMGWLIQPDHNGYRRIAHTGGMPGVSTGLYLYPEEDLAIAVLTNRSNALVPQIAHRIASVMLPGYRTTFEERQDAAADEPEAEESFQPPAELLGEWSGTIRTYEDELPLMLRFQADGDVHVRIGDGLVTLLNDVSFRNGRLRGRSFGTIPTEDTRRHDHDILVDLRLRGDALTGAVTALGGEGGAYFALSAYAEVAKRP